MPLLCRAFATTVMHAVSLLGREGGTAAQDEDDDAMEEREAAYAQLITAEPEFVVSEVSE